MGNKYSRALGQSFFLPPPTLTEANVKDQSGKVHIVTGGYAGCGAALCKILYGANATVYVAGRSQSKADAAISSIKAALPNSTGKIEFLSLDLSDLKSIKPAVDSFLQKEQRLDVLTNNAGVMFPPKGSVDAQGYELQIGTNCLGSFLLTELLRPILAQTATQAEPGTVRVTWAGSLAVDILSPSPGGLKFDDNEEGKPQVLDQQSNYGQSKAGNLLLCSEAAKRWGTKDGVVHLCWNPGNLKTELQRHTPTVTAFFLNFMLHPSVYGAYTELFAALSPSISLADSGSFIHPWGRIGGYREDIADGLKAKSEGGTGVAEKFWNWCDKASQSFQ